MEVDGPKREKWATRLPSHMGLPDLGLRLRFKSGPLLFISGPLWAHRPASLPPTLGPETANPRSLWSVPPPVSRPHHPFLHSFLPRRERWLISAHLRSVESTQFFIPDPLGRTIRSAKGYLPSYCRTLEVSRVPFQAARRRGHKSESSPPTCACKCNLYHHMPIIIVQVIYRARRYQWANEYLPAAVCTSEPDQLLVARGSGRRLTYTHVFVNYLSSVN